MLTKIKNNLKNMNGLLLTLTIIMFLYGLFNIVTASSREAVVRYGLEPYHYFIRHLIMLTIGFVGSIVIVNTSSKKFPLYSFILYAAVFTLIVYMLFEGTADRGSINWITLPIIGTFQPSEFAKPITIVFLAFLMDKLSNLVKMKDIKRWGYIMIIFGVMFAIPFFVFLENDMGTACIILFIAGVMFLGGPVLLKDKLQAFLFCAIMIVCIASIRFITSGYILTEEQVSRITSFVNPCSKYVDGGYQTCNAFIAINNGCLLGVGIGESTQKYSYIPEPHTDSVFSIIAEEYGFLFCTVILIVMIIIIQTILKISLEATTLMGRYICLGAAAYIFIHVIINLGGLFGLLPLTGVPLPFLSYGGTFTVSLMGILAVVQRVAIESNIAKKRIKI